MSIDKFDNNLEQFWKKTPNSAFSSLLKTLLRYNLGTIINGRLIIVFLPEIAFETFTFTDVKIREHF